MAVDQIASADKLAGFSIDGQAVQSVMCAKCPACSTADLEIVGEAHFNGFGGKFFSSDFSSSFRANNRGSVEVLIGH
jgi:hypothetical protein